MGTKYRGTVEERRALDALIKLTRCTESVVERIHAGITEPGGVLLEVATDGPGFTLDEEVSELGETLVLPPWLESQRDEIERGLPPLVAPQPAAATT